MSKDRSRKIRLQSGGTPGEVCFSGLRQSADIRGGERKTGKQKGGFLPVRQFANTHYKNYPERYFWANQDCITLDDIPYMGVYGRTLPNVYVATGFNEWGMTSSMIASIILSNMISGKRTAFEEVFNPSRSVLKPRLFSNLGSTVINLALPPQNAAPILAAP